MTNAQEWLAKNYPDKNIRQIIHYHYTQSLQGELNLNEYKNLEKISLTGHELTNINLEGCSQLTYLNLENNYHLTNLNLKGCTNLTYLNLTEVGEEFEGGKINIDFKQCPNLTKLVCNNDKLRCQLLISKSDWPAWPQFAEAFWPQKIIIRLKDFRANKKQPAINGNTFLLWRLSQAWQADWGKPETYWNLLQEWVGKMNLNIKDYEDKWATFTSFWNQRQELKQLQQANTNLLAELSQLKKEKSDLTNKLKDHEQTITNYQQKLEQLNSNYQLLEKQKNSLARKELSEKFDSLFPEYDNADSIEDALDLLRTRINSKEQELIQLREQTATSTASLRKEIENLKGELKSIQSAKDTKIIDLKGQLTALALNIGLLNKQCEDLTIKLSTSEQESQRRQLELKIKEELCKQKDNSLSEQEQKIKDYQSLLRTVEIQLKKAQESITEKDKQLEQLIETKDNLTELLDQAETKINSLETSLVASHTRIAELESQIKDLKAKDDNSEEGQRSSTEQLARSKQELTTLKINSQKEINSLKSQLQQAKQQESQLAQKIQSLSQKNLEIISNNSYWKQIKTPLLWGCGIIILLAILKFWWNKLNFS